MRTLLTAFVVLAFAPLPLHAQPGKLTDAQRKAAFLKLLDRPKVDPDVKTTRFTVRDGLQLAWLTLATEKNADGSIERMPFLMVTPVPDPNGMMVVKRPLVIVMHGTGGNKDAMLPWLLPFANQGLAAIAIDARYHGDRAGGGKGKDAYVAAITKAWKTPAGQPQEHPFYYDTCCDLWRLIDWAVSTGHIDPDRIGMLGTSMGGIQCWLAAAVDERVKAAVPLVGVQSFRWSLDNDRWQGRAKTIQPTHDIAAKDLGEKEVNQRVCRELWSKIVPGILDDFDAPQMLPLFAGRHLFIANGDMDPNCPIEGAKLAIATAKDAYAKAGCPEKLTILIEEGVAHKVTDTMRKQSIEFLTKALAK